MNRSKKKKARREAQAAVTRKLLDLLCSYSELQKLHKLLGCEGRANAKRGTMLDRIMKSDTIRHRRLHGSDLGGTWQLYAIADTHGLLPKQVDLVGTP